MSVRSEIESSLKKVQRGLRVKASDQFWRGLSLVTVNKSGPQVEFTVMDSAEDEEMSRAEFIGRSLMRVPHGKTKRFNFLRQVFSILGNKQLSKRQRVTIGKKYAGLAKSMDDARTIRRWMLALAQDDEPKGFRNE